MTPVVCLLVYFFVLFYYFFSLCLIENFCSEWKMCVCAFNGFDFWCWLQGGPVCEENWYEWTWSFFSFFSLSSPLFNWSPCPASRPELVPVDLVICGFKYIIFILIHMEVTLLEVAHLRPTFMFNVNSSSTGFSLWKKKMFWITLQSSRFALAYLTWAFSRSQSLLLARPSVSLSGLQRWAVADQRTILFLFYPVFSLTSCMCKDVYPFGIDCSRWQFKQ